MSRRSASHAHGPLDPALTSRPPAAADHGGGSSPASRDGRPYAAADRHGGGSAPTPRDGRPYAAADRHGGGPLPAPRDGLVVSCADGVLEVALAQPHRCLSSAVLGGGLGWLRTWLDVQVPPDYARTDPAAHLAALAAARAAAPPVVGMLTAADVDAHIVRRAGGVVVVATVGVSHALAAATTRPGVHGAGAVGAAAGVLAGTINLLAVCDTALSPAGLVNAAQTIVEAKAQALADAGILAGNAAGFATGTATDSLAIACPPSSSPACPPSSSPACPPSSSPACPPSRSPVWPPSRSPVWPSPSSPVWPSPSSPAWSTACSPAYCCTPGGGASSRNVPTAWPPPCAHPAPGDGDAGRDFAGPATAVGARLASAVHAAVLAGVTGEGP